jgi:hypothetical protein
MAGRPCKGAKGRASDGTDRIGPGHAHGTRSAQHWTLSPMKIGPMLVPPALAQHILQFHTSAMIVRLFRQYTPAFVRKALRYAGNTLMFLLKHPWLNTLALLITKSLRMVLCLAAFGIEDTEWTAIKVELLGVAQPERRYPILNAVLDIAGHLLGCIRDTVGGAFLSCADRLAELGLIGIPIWIVHLMIHTCLLILRAMGPIGVTMADGASYGIAVIGDAYGLYKTATWTSAWRLATRIIELVSKNNYTVDKGVAIVDTNGRMVTGMLQPLQTIFREFYTSTNMQMSTGILLWIMRRIPADAFMNGFSVFWAMIPAQCRTHALLCATLDAAVVSFPHSWRRRTQWWSKI